MISHIQLDGFHLMLSKALKNSSFCPRWCYSSGAGVNRQKEPFINIRLRAVLLRDGLLGLLITEDMQEWRYNNKYRPASASILTAVFVAMQCVLHRLAFHSNLISG